jgi:large subunit ribosomal protein L29
VKVKDIRDLTSEELQRKLESLKEELFNLRFQVATGQLDNPMRMREVRRTIAQVKTVLRERELGINQA